jgi:hypothetical protein
MRVALLMAGAAILAGCGSSKAKSPFVAKTEGGALEVRLTPTGSPRTPARADAYGQSHIGDISSLQYFMTQVVLCQSLELNAAKTAIVSVAGCLSLFEGEDQPDAMLALAAARSGATGYVDLVNDASRTAFRPTTRLDSQMTGTYRYGFISWRSAIKMTARVPVAVANESGAGVTQQVWNTRDGTSTPIACQEGVSCPAAQTQVASQFSDGETAQEAVFIDSDGGTIFELFRPLSITDEDIAEKKDLVLDLFFDLEGAVFGIRSASCDPSDALVDSGVHDYASGAGGVCNVITVPRLRFSPVLRRGQETVTKHVYAGRINGVGYDPSGTATSPRCSDAPIPECRQSFDVRLSLYASVVDGTTTVLAADLRTAYPSEDTAVAVVSPGLRVPQVPVLGAVDRFADGSFDIRNLQGLPLVKGVAPPTTANAGSEISVTFACGPGLLSFAGCGVEGISDETFNPSSWSSVLVLESASEW